MPKPLVSPTVEVIYRVEDRPPNQTWIGTLIQSVLMFRLITARTEFRIKDSISTLTPQILHKYSTILEEKPKNISLIIPSPLNDRIAACFINTPQRKVLVHLCASIYD
ncbi:hypothetical protein TWF225_001627 [Orbilia oligospora]|uniref:Uncharacterized protein n=1 Tax=Orbilia oligospora TaxID=2813651 RepID=A0A7C8K2M5_ORBOL|nr:hypothetical protein TWF751_005040 [Orbilia oligospora]KAF3164641.1 hypothetical protein TWF225_001627 [Orbilia oligospora]KAF3256749.1 hypothetical protein TWF128_005251 [Orbilia oligospora]KAF3272527.1 hypothetical protein TWF217_000020 [Orbilia oligospora]KAF3292030.1 hypothetical protein TWF132_006274 [Orbilia oligospora]